MSRFKKHTDTGSFNYGYDDVLDYWWEERNFDGEIMDEDHSVTKAKMSDKLEEYGVDENHIYLVLLGAPI